MSKPIFSFNRNEVPNTLGMDYIIGAIEKSGLFEIRNHNDTIPSLRGYRALLIYLNDKKVYMDFWEYPNPTYSMEVIRYNPDLIIKLQHREMTHDQYNRICQRKNFMAEATPEQRIALLEKIVPFTFFPSRMFMPFVEKIEDIVPEPIDKTGFFCGKVWKCRLAILEALKKANIECDSSNQGIHKTISDEEYLKKMKGSKFGIVLRGRASMLTDAKNRREVDYMMLKRPLLLNYKPFYYNPLVEGKHYIYFDEKTDLDNLEKMYNIQEIVNNATQWYNDNASPSGVVKVFMQILKDRNIL